MSEPFKSSVKPLIGPSIRWDEFIKDTLDLTGRNPIKVLDGSTLKLTPFAKFIVALEGFKEGTAIKPLQSLYSASAVLEHLSFSFLITASSSVILKLNEVTQLSIVSASLNNGRAAVVSGTLGEWKTSITSICNNLNKNYTNAELRYIANTCLEYFYIMGLKYIFKDYKKKSLTDGTFLLEYKP